MNERIISYLKKLEQTANTDKQTYRALAFNKAIQIIKSLKFELKDAEQVKGLSGIGKGILNRITEILNTGKLREVDNAIVDAKSQVIENFMTIHGVGQKTAEKWYDKGEREIKDVLKNEKLTSVQKVGLKYMDELNLKIKRIYVKEIDTIIQNTIDEINKKFKLQLECVITGSYRRMLPECGDIDCLLTMKNSYLSDDHIDYFLKKLKEKGLLTDELGWGESKFTGVCVDSKGVHRRIDFEFVKDYKSYPYELLYFTGSQAFNVGMRHIAKEKGLLLNQNGLFEGSKKIIAYSEKDIFDILGMKYLKPEERY